MTEHGDITTIRAGADFHVCPACGYDLGFHTSFISVNADRDNPVKSTREVYRVILICPECRARFDVGWRVSFSEPESRFVRAPAAHPEPPQVSVVPVAVQGLPPAHPPSHDRPPSE